LHRLPIIGNGLARLKSGEFEDVPFVVELPDEEILPGRFESVGLRQSGPPFNEQHPELGRVRTLSGWLTVSPAETPPKRRKFRPRPTNAER
jgi:hypothetical protein